MTHLRFPTLVHFFGPDGAGKTTQVDMLLHIEGSNAFRVKKFWMRSPHTLAFLAWQLLIRIGFYRVIRNSLGGETKVPAVSTDRVLKSFWLALEFLSVLPLIMRFRLAVIRGYSIIAERFILDTIVTMAFFIDDRKLIYSRLSKLLLLFIPQDTVFIFLDTDYWTIFDRRAHLFGSKTKQQRVGAYGSVPSLGVEPQRFIEFQRECYKAFAKQFNALTIDTSKRGKEETHDTILKYLNSKNRTRQ